MCLNRNNFTVCLVPGTSISACPAVFPQENSKSHCHCLSTKYLHFHLPFSICHLPVAKLPTQVLRPKFQSAFSTGSITICSPRYSLILSGSPLSPFPFPQGSASFNVSHLKMHATVHCPESILMVGRLLNVMTIRLAGHLTDQNCK